MRLVDHRLLDRRARMGIGAPSHDLRQRLATKPDAKRLIAPDILALDGIKSQAKGQQDNEQGPEVEPSSKRPSHKFSLAQPHCFGNPFADQPGCSKMNSP